MSAGFAIKEAHLETVHEEGEEGEEVDELGGLKLGDNRGDESRDELGHTRADRADELREGETGL